MRTIHPKYHHSPKYWTIKGVTCYTGRVASGKTLSAVRHIVELGKYHNTGPVVSNVPLDVKKYVEFHSGDLPTYASPEFLSNPPGIFLFDVTFWPHDFDHPSSEVYLNYLVTMAKKAGWRIILVTQRLADLPDAIYCGLDDVFECRYDHESQPNVCCLARANRNTRRLTMYDPFLAEPYFKYYDIVANVPLPEVFKK